MGTHENYMYEMALAKIDHYQKEVEHEALVKELKMANKNNKPVFWYRLGEQLIKLGQLMTKQPIQNVTNPKRS